MTKSKVDSDSSRLHSVTTFSKPVTVRDGQTLEQAMAEQGVTATTQRVAAKKSNPKSPWRTFTKHYFSKRGQR